MATSIAPFGEQALIAVITLSSVTVVNQPSVRSIFRGCRATWLTRGVVTTLFVLILSTIAAAQGVGAILWTMGGAGNDFAFDVRMPAFIHQHGVRVAGVGQLLLLDNLGEPASRAERYEYGAGTHLAHLMDSHVSVEGVTAQIGGSTQILPGGHTLLSFGSGGAVEEYDAHGQLVWRLKGTPGYIFRAQRIRSLYQPGVGDHR